MKFGRDITKNLAQTAYVMNVLDGGIAMPLVSFDKQKKEYIYLFKLPGVEPDDFSVEIDNQNLFVYHRISFDEVAIPHLLNRIIIPADVDYDLISAEFEDGKLKIVMPFW
ncbi:MAG: Hsp20/alpha crystallin family protein, partial [Bacteroidota bacterium]